jgi:hypothetical protein
MWQVQTPNNKVSIMQSGDFEDDQQNTGKSDAPTNSAV